MVEPAFRTLLVSAIGHSVLLDSRSVAAGTAAVALSAIAVRTEKEHRMTVLAQANALPENHFAVCRHASPQGGLDSGRRVVAP
jgi:hypothetical protein